MNHKGRILIVDDEVRWRDILQETLLAEGYAVDAVSTATDVRLKIKQDLYHLFVFDIRLVDGDPENEDGMQLLKALFDELDLGGAVEAIILSAYGTREQMREAFREYDVADFIDKQDFDNIDFAEQVNEIFAERVRINLGLDVQWPTAASPLDIVQKIKMPNGYIGDNGPLQIQIGAELTDLLSRLFHQANSLLVKNMALGFSGTQVIWGQPIYKGTGEGQGFVIKFGNYLKIEQEFENYKTYVQPFLGGTYTTNILDLRRTPRLGGIIYTYIGTDNDKLEDFGTYYRRSRASEVKRLLNDLFKNICDRWYRNVGPIQHVNLSEHYRSQLGLVPEKLEDIVKSQMPTVLWQADDTLCFRVLDGNRSFLDPIKDLSEQRFIFSTFECITHGDLNESNILLDNSGRTWLIDFRDTGKGHVFRDLAKLDTVVRLDLLITEDATLEDRLALENALLTIDDFSNLSQIPTSLQASNPSVIKAFEVAFHLRKLARDIVAHHQSGDYTEYNTALYYQALHALTFKSLSPIQREHALLSACLLKERITLREKVPI